MTTVSPQSTSIVGPGNDPLIASAHRGRPSGDKVAWPIVSQNSLVIPVSGTVAV